MTNGNIETVARALEGITGVAKIVAAQDSPDRYLLMARMNRELDTVDSLRRSGFAAYWPSYETLVPTREKLLNGRLKRRMQRVGIIPGYVFCAVNPTRDLFGMLDRIIGAIDVARTFSGNPLAIGDADIQIIRRIEAGLNTPQTSGKAIHAFKRGQRVRFVDDLVGRWPPGVIEKLAHDGRISVEVALMGRKVPIMVLPHQIEKA